MRKHVAQACHVRRAPRRAVPTSIGSAHLPIRGGSCACILECDTSRRKVRWFDEPAKLSGNSRQHLLWLGSAGVASAALGMVISGDRTVHCRTSDNSDHMFPKPLSVPSGDYVQSQKHLLKATDHNPQPTLLPPPAAALSAIGRHERLVASFIGLPLRGKGYMAQRLKQYLEFFHGVEVAMFDICQFTEPGGDQRLLRSMGDFFAGGEQDSQNTHAHQAEQSVKGRFAILYTKDTQDSLPSMWGGHEKFRRRWMAETLEENLQASIMFIEIQADDTALHRQTIWSAWSMREA